MNTPQVVGKQMEETSQNRSFMELPYWAWSAEPR